MPDTLPMNSKRQGVFLSGKYTVVGAGCAHDSMMITTSQSVRLRMMLDISIDVGPLRTTYNCARLIPPNPRITSLLL